MMAMNNVQVKKVGLIGALVMVLCLMISTFLPTQTFATTTTNGTDVSVTMTNGSVSITGAGFDAQNDGKAWTNFFTKYKTVISGVSGIAAITFIAFFIFYFMKLGATAGNPQARSQALLGLLWTGIAAAGLGSVSIVVGFFYNSMK